MKSEPIKGASGVRTLFSFPHPVNEYAARTVAGLVLALTLIIILADVRWLMFLLAYGFLARVLSGPKLSPFGLLATRVIVPRIIKRSRLVAGPPKQFAQGVGLIFSTSALLLTYGFGMVGAAHAVLAVLAVFAALESIAGFCAGCFVFGYLMRWGIIPAELCERCNDLSFSISA